MVGASLLRKRKRTKSETWGTVLDTTKAMDRRKHKRGERRIPRRDKNNKRNFDIKD